MASRRNNVASAKKQIQIRPVEKPYFVKATQEMRTTFSEMITFSRAEKSLIFNRKE
jgi:hypothetical protein